jgi:hypothetical protein
MTQPVTLEGIGDLVPSDEGISMIGVCMFVLIYGLSLSRDELPPLSSDVIHLATALDHLTVLEFGEPVTMAAAGSPAFQIERHDDKVFIKPLKAGASTDLFVWTASRRFTYELEPPGEVKKMNFAVDSRLPTSKPVPDSAAHMDEIADMMLTRVFLGSERVDSSNLRAEKGRVIVRIEHVFQSKNTLYIHYSIRNRSARHYRVNSPAVAEAHALHPSVSVMAFHRVQLDETTLRQFGRLTERQLALARAETQKEDLQPGEETQGIVAIREELTGPTIFQLTFAREGPHQVRATMVF